MDVSLFFFADTGATAGDGYRLLVDSARFADANGLSAVWTPERHFHSFGGLYPNPAVTGAAVASVTERIAVRAGSVVAPLHHPVRIAEEWSMIDNLSGVPAGGEGDPGPENYSSRKDVMVDALGVVRKLWRGEAVDYPDGTGEKRSVRIYPTPVQPELPVWVTSAGSPETFRTAGRLGAGLLTHLLGQDLDRLAQNIRVYREHRADGGGHVVLMLHTLLGTDRSRVWDLVREPLSDYLRSSADLVVRAASGLVPPDFDIDRLPERDREYLIARAAERYFTTSGLFGTPEDAAQTVRRLEAVGVDEIACLIDFGVPHAEVMRSLELVAGLCR